MSIYRALARMSAVCALNNYMEAPFPTLAGPNIFDSKIEPVEDMAIDVAFPCCVVYTDYDKDHWTRGELIHQARVMSLTVELMVVTSKTEGTPADPLYSLDCPLTDSEIETTLDALETQVFRALAMDNEAAHLFNFICVNPVQIISRRGASAEGGSRLAARQLTIEMKAVREPHTGDIPAQVEKFLTRIETFNDYADRVNDIREMLTFNAGLTDFGRHLQTLGTTADVLQRMGHAKNPGAVLPPNITYTWNGINP